MLGSSTRWLTYFSYDISHILHGDENSIWETWLATSSFNSMFIDTIANISTVYKCCRLSISDQLKIYLFPRVLLYALFFARVCDGVGLHTRWFCPDLIFAPYSYTPVSSKFDTCNWAKYFHLFCSHNLFCSWCFWTCLRCVIGLVWRMLCIVNLAVNELVACALTSSVIYLPLEVMTPD